MLVLSITNIDFASAILGSLFAIVGIITCGLCAWEGLTFSEGEYKRGKHKKDLGWGIGLIMIPGLMCSVRIFTGEFNVGIPAIVGLILTLIGALLVYSK